MLSKKTPPPLTLFLICNMQSLKMIPSASSLVSLYASLSTTLMLLRNLYNELIPDWVEKFITQKISDLFTRKKPPLYYMTMIVDESWNEFEHNELVDAARVYLPKKIGPKNKLIRVGKFEDQKRVTTGLVDGEEVVDVFDGIEITWQYGQPKDDSSKKKYEDEDDYFRLKVEDKFKDRILDEYFPHVLRTYKELTQQEKVLKLYSRPNTSWVPVDLMHPATFGTLAMDDDLKKTIKNDLDRFLARREFFKRVGKAWKRGYLLYGPPGTGKSSLVSAIARYLNFDVYDVELQNICGDSDLKRALYNVNNKSIVVFEDIDCNPSLHARSNNSADNDSDSDDDHKRYHRSFSLAALLNGIDGLWSSCGEERIIIFTTNRKEVLDPALLRPGRMDMHINMSYCTPQGFRVLASNYFGVEDHKLLEEIDALLRAVEVTPATLSEELLRNDGVDDALADIVTFLKQKKIEKDQAEEDDKSEILM